MPGKTTIARRIDAPLSFTGGEALGESSADVAPPAEQAREKPENLALDSALVRSAVTPEAQITATWDSPDGVTVDQYVIQVSADSSFPDDATTTRFTPRDQPSATIQGLATNTAYYVRVAAIVRAVYSDWTDTEAETTPDDTVAPDPVTSAAADFTGPDLLLSWTNPENANLRNVRVSIYASNGGALLRTLTAASSSVIYPYDLNKADAGGSGDPSLYVTLHAVSHADVDSSQVALSPTNAAPSAPTVGATTGFSQILATVTSTPPTDFDVYEFVWKNSGGTPVRTAYSKSASDTYQASSSDTYSVEVRVRDVFGQYSAAGTATGLTVDALTLSDLRARIVYSDSDSNAAATLKAALADDNRASGGISYASNASWVREIRADWQLTERLKTITLSMTPSSGTTNWYVRTSTDGTTWSYFAGPVTSSRILTSVANAAAAQAAAVSAATLGNPSASRVDLSALVEARYVELWLRNTAASTRVDEFYPRRFVQSDDIEAESIRAINIAAGSITADRLSVTQLSAITADMGSLTAGAIVIGSTNKIWLNDSADGALNIGGSVKASAPFRVTAAGALTSTSATITGTINFGAGSGLLDAAGLTMIDATVAGTLTATRAVTWRASSLTGTVSSYVQGSQQAGTNVLDVFGLRNGTTSGGQVRVFADGDTGAELDLAGALSANPSSATLRGTNITIDATDLDITGSTSNAGSLAVGTASAPGVRLDVAGTDASYSAGPHAEFTTSADAHPQLQILPYEHDNISLQFDAYYNGTNWKSSDAGSNYQLIKLSDVFTLRYASGVSAGSNITWTDGIAINTSGTVSIAAGLNVGSATGAAAGEVRMTYNDATTATTVVPLVMTHNSSGTPAANFGVGVRFRLKDSTTVDTDAGQVDARWATATHGSQKGRVSLFAADNAAFREGLRVESSGTAAMIGFLGATAVARPTVSGSRGANAALASLCTALASLGLITDSTS